MKISSLEYIQFLKNEVINIINNTININSVNDITFNINVNFHIYYFEIFKGKDFLENNNFFKPFKHQYSLQGISNSFLEYLEDEKYKIIKLIEKDSIAEIYFTYFKKASIKHGEKEVLKDLGSFFTKFIHTFKPNEYCALDNPVKDYFNLQKESFVLAFLIVSEAYQEWSERNDKLLLVLRAQLKKSDQNHCIEHTLITNHKILDMVFWSKTNTPKINR